MPFQQPLCLPSKIKGNMSNIFAEHCIEPQNIPHWKSCSYYLGVWIQHTVPEEKKYSLFAFRRGCTKLQETELIKPRHTNRFQIVSQTHFFIHLYPRTSMILPCFHQGQGPARQKLFDTAEQHMQIFFNPSCCKSYAPWVWFIPTDGKTALLITRSFINTLSLFMP